MGSKPYILSVDDDSFTQDIVSESLQDEFEINCAANGQDCLDSVAIRVPDLILIDIYMPVLDGFQTTKRLRLNQKLNNLPIIFLSGLNSDEIMKNAYESGANAFLSKPLDKKELKATIRQLLNLNLKKWPEDKK